MLYPLKKRLVEALSSVSTNNNHYNSGGTNFSYYVAGQYELNKLNSNGQRINIIIKIPRKDKSGDVTFTTGWMVEPNGKIRLITPYADD